MSTQLRGNLKIGPTVGTAVEFGSHIFKFNIKRTRTAVRVPPTLATGRSTTQAGDLLEELEISFKSSHAAAELWAELWDAIDTDTSELYFEGTLNPGAVSADNPKFSGKFVVLSLETAPDVGALRTQTQTYPITVAGVTKAIA